MRVNRRTAIASGAALVGSVLTGAVVGEYEGNTSPRPPDPPSDTAVSRGTLLSGSDRETTYFEIGDRTDGPSGVVLGGVHGDEVNGYRAAERIVEWDLDHGSLVVVPWADIAAIRSGTRQGPDGDLNRKFPAGERPETELARELWGLVVDSEPDVVVDLHRSRGIFRTHPRWVGQAIFPTAAGDARTEAGAVVRRMNDGAVPRTMRFHRFSVGNTLSGGNPMLVHKAGADLGTPGYIVELTEFLLNLDTQIRWTERIAELLFARHGIERTEGA